MAADGGPAGMVQKAAVFLVLDVEEVGEVGTLEVEMGHRASHRGGKSESIGSPFHPATAAGGARASAVAQLLFAAPTVSAAKGVRGGYEALQELQRNAGKPLEVRAFGGVDGVYIPAPSNRLLVEGCWTLTGLNW